MPNNGQRTFIIGCGCTAFIKVCSYSQGPCLFQPKLRDADSQERQEQLKMWVPMILCRVHNSIALQMGLEAATKALLDAGQLSYISGSIWACWQFFTGITYDEIEAAFVGYCYGDSTSGQVCPIISSATVPAHYLHLGIPLQSGFDWDSNY